MATNLIEKVKHFPSGVAYYKLTRKPESQEDKAELLRATYEEYLDLNFLKVVEECGTVIYLYNEFKEVDNDFIIGLYENQGRDGV